MIILSGLAYWLDCLAGRWLDWHLEQLSKRNPNTVETEIEGCKMGGVQVILKHPDILLLADHVASTLDEAKAEDYFQFTMMPRPDRARRPIEVTVRWADKGLTPAAKNKLLQKAIDALAPHAMHTCAISIQDGEVIEHVMCKLCGATYTKDRPEHKKTCVLGKI